MPSLASPKEANATGPASDIRKTTRGLLSHNFGGRRFSSRKKNLYTTKKIMARDVRYELNTRFDPPKLRYAPPDYTVTLYTTRLSLH